MAKVEGRPFKLFDIFLGNFWVWAAMKSTGSQVKGTVTIFFQICVLTLDVGIE
jgi:hypothetical protein